MAAMVLLWSAPPITHALPDSDDYMRMIRVFDIIDGKDNPSYFEPRLGMNGAELGWSRLVDWPLAGMQIVLEQFSGRTSAALWTATLMPAAMLLLMITALWYYLKPALGAHYMPLAILALFLQWAVLRQFIPGRVDHHMWQILLVTIAYGGLWRFYVTPQNLRAPAITGICFAAGLAIGADMLPWLALGAALTGFFWFIHGRIYERPALVLGIATAVTAIILHLLASPSDRLWQVSCDSLSPFWLSLAGAVAMFWVIITLIPRRWSDTHAKRFICGGITATAIAAALYVSFSSCFTDPYMIEDDVVRQIWLHNVNEAQTLPALWQNNPSMAAFFAIPVLLGFIGNLYAIQSDAPRRIFWIGVACIIASGLLLGFYQVRTLDYTQILSVLPLTYLLIALTRRLKAVANALSRPQRLSIASGFFLLALISVIVAMQKDQPAPTQHKAPECNLHNVTDTLRDMNGPLRIAAHIDIGAAILFNTNHQVLAAPYHRNEKGIRAAYDIFTAENADNAMKHIAASATDIIIYCENPDNFWSRVAPSDNAFIDQLVSGNVPSWLTLLSEPSSGYKIYKVEYRP